MFPSLIPVAPSDNPFLFTVYASARAEELISVPWPEQIKQAFLESQFEAQNRHYSSVYPDASFDLIQVENQRAGRLYRAELADEIRIIDISLLPQFRNRGIGTFLLSEILKTGQSAKKSVRIYLESNNKSQTLFSRLGFNPISDNGIYFLWEKRPEEAFQTTSHLTNTAAGQRII